MIFFTIFTKMLSILDKYWCFGLVSFSPIVGENGYFSPTNLLLALVRVIPL